MIVASTHREQNLSDVDAGDGAVGLAPRTAHAGLQSIGTSARQHFVDANDVEGMGAHAEVEAFLSSNLDEISIC